jgi:hypothetical protein
VSLVQAVATALCRSAAAAGILKNRTKRQPVCQDNVDFFDERFALEPTLSSRLELRPRRPGRPSPEAQTGMLNKTLDDRGNELQGFR